MSGYNATSDGSVAEPITPDGRRMETGDAAPAGPAGAYTPAPTKTVNVAAVKSH